MIRYYTQSPYLFDLKIPLSFGVSKSPKLKGRSIGSSRFNDQWNLFSLLICYLFYDIFSKGKEKKNLYEEYTSGFS